MRRPDAAQRFRFLPACDVGNYTEAAAADLVAVRENGRPQLQPSIFIISLPRTELDTESNPGIAAVVSQSIRVDLPIHWMNPGDPLFLPNGTCALVSSEEARVPRQPEHVCVKV